ncbi:hypothetical protein CEV31_1306 [Brucella thiophenivorans]|uniref:Uncharacterized protein n=1 Tax=Brucella thiophenivorans TaxID=571255 RepID=A0A256FYG4_9HYPH|nr:hypothetical protein CEV31_1306 [Brucella thiophenivorans]
MLRAGSPFMIITATCIEHSALKSKKAAFPLPFRFVSILTL